MKRRDGARDLAVSRTAGRRLAELRKSHGLTRRALSQKLLAAGYPMSETTITHAENGHPNGHFRAMIVDDANALAAIFGVSVESFFAEPSCHACLDTPPQGYTCNVCHRGCNPDKGGT